MKQSNPLRAGQGELFWMFLAAALFGYFGWGMSWAHEWTIDSPPKIVYMVSLLKWTVRIGAVLFGVAAVLTLMGTIFGPLLYGLAGLATSVSFVVVAVWDMMEPDYFSGAPPFLLLIFAAWNGWMSWLGLREFIEPRSAAAADNGTFS